MKTEIEVDNQLESWMNSKWRPAMSWVYLVICIMDFIIFPILWTILQAGMHQKVTQWEPITLDGAGLLHLSFGAILGVAAYGRTREKLAGVTTNVTTSTRVSERVMSISNDTNEQIVKPIVRRPN